MPTIANISSKLVLDIGEFRTNASAADRQTARLTARMEKQAAAVGLTRNEAKLQQLAQRGATEEQLKAARAAQARVRAAEASAAADRRAAQLTDRARTSSERYAAEVADLRDLQRSGRITAQTYARSLDRLAEEHGQGRRAVLRHLTAQQRLNGALRRTPDLARASGRSVTIAAGATAVAAIAAGAAISRLYRGRAEDIDAAAKLADSIGINTRELQGLRLAAELTGAGSDAMDKSLARLQRSVGEAARGTGTARLAFAELGLDVEKLARLSVDDQFRAIADAFAAVESRTTRTTLAYQIFGRQGTALVNTLALGSAGLNETTAEAAKLGIAFDRIDAAKIEAANDASTRAATAVTGLANTLAIELAPIVAASADRFTAWAGAGEGAASSIVGAVDRVAVKIAGIVDAFQLPIAGFRQLVSIGLRGIANVVRAIRDIDAAMSYIVSLIPGVEIAASGMLDDLTEQLTDAADDAQDQARRAYRAWEQGANTRAVTQSLRQIRKEAQTTAEAVAAAAQAKGPAPTVADPDAGGAADAVTKQLDQLDAKLRAATADPITLQLEGLEAAGATADQLARAHAAPPTAAKTRASGRSTACKPPAPPPTSFNAPPRPWPPPKRSTTRTSPAKRPARTRRSAPGRLRRSSPRSAPPPKPAPAPTSPRPTRCRPPSSPRAAAPTNCCNGLTAAARPTRPAAAKRPRPPPSPWWSSNHVRRHHHSAIRELRRRPRERDRPTGLHGRV